MKIVQFIWVLVLAGSLLGSFHCVLDEESGDDQEQGLAATAGVLLLQPTATQIQEDPTDDTQLEVLGTWSSNFGGDVVITETTWTGYSANAILEFNNETNQLYFQHSADDDYNPSKFGRIDWTEPANSAFYYCMIVYGQDTLEDAKNNSATTDASDPETSGCNGFPWTRLELQS